MCRTTTPRSGPWRPPAWRPKAWRAPHPSSGTLQEIGGRVESLGMDRGESGRVRPRPDELAGIPREPGADSRGAFSLTLLLFGVQAIALVFVLVLRRFGVVA